MVQFLWSRPLGHITRSLTLQERPEHEESSRGAAFSKQKSHVKTEAAEVVPCACTGILLSSVDWLKQPGKKEVSAGTKTSSLSAGKEMSWVHVERGTRASLIPVKNPAGFALSQCLCVPGFRTGLYGNMHWRSFPLLKKSCV